MDTSLIVPKDSAGVTVLLLVSIVIPLIVGLITKQKASAAVKAYAMVLLNLVAAVLVAFVTAHNNGVGFDWNGALYSFITSAVVSAVAHFAVLKPIGVTGTTGAIQSSVPGGIGGDATVPPTLPLTPLGDSATQEL
jgi:uncharacterized membrane protein (DUF441 family)